MEQLVYKNILFASYVVMYAYGLFLLLTSAPQAKEYQSYRISRKLFAATMIMWASYLVIHWYFNPRLYNMPLALTLCLSCFFSGIMLFELTFSSLIRHGYPVAKRVTQIIISAVVINIIIFANYLFSPEPLRHSILVIMTVLFALEMALLSIKFYKTYRETLKNADNYYSDNVDIFIKWMPTSIGIAILFGFAGTIFFYGSSWAVSFYMFGGLLLFTYIFVSYQNYMINITKIKEFILTHTPESPSEIEGAKSKAPTSEGEQIGEVKGLEDRLQRWIEQKGFTKHGLTIEELALEIGTNRTYLSLYINTTYNVSFREWIAKQRIEYAKELLLGSNELPSSKIAEMVGYTPNAFTTIFSKVERMTPMQWRSINISK